MLLKELNYGSRWMANAASSQKESPALSLFLVGTLTSFPLQDWIVAPDEGHFRSALNPCQRK